MASLESYGKSRLRTTSRKCGICGTIADNPIIGSESPCAFWGSRQWMPEGVYTLARCRACGTLYVDSDVTEEYLTSVQAEFCPQVKYSEYESVLRASEFVLNWQMMKNCRRPKRGDKLLDFGCSFGDFGTIAKKDGVQPNGVELIPQAAQFSLEKWGGESRVHAGSLKDAPFKKGEFQYITAFETLEHLRDPIRLLLQLRELLSDDGILAISVPSADYFRFKFWFYRKQPFSRLARRWMPGNMQDGRVLCHNHIHTFSVNSARLLFEHSGLLPVLSKAIGWRGKAGSIGTPIARLLEGVSGKKIAFTPSIFMIGRKTRVIR